MGKTRVIWDWDTSSWNQDESKEMYEETYGRTPSDEELSAFVEENNSKYLSDVISEIEHYESVHGKKSQVVVAKLGLWNGTFDGGKIIVGLANVIRECFEDYNRLYVDGRRLRISASHHDGTNTFEIKELTDNGADYADRHDYDTEPRELHAKLFNSSNYSREVKLFADVYGW